MTLHIAQTGCEKSLLHPLRLLRHTTHLLCDARECRCRSARSAPLEVLDGKNRAHQSRRRKVGIAERQECAVIIAEVALLLLNTGHTVEQVAVLLLQYGIPFDRRTERPLCGSLAGHRHRILQTLHDPAVRFLRVQQAEDGVAKIDGIPRFRVFVIESLQRRGTTTEQFQDGLVTHRAPELELRHGL